MRRPIRILHVIDKFSMDGVNPSSCAKLFVEWISRHDPGRFRVEVAGLRPPDPAGQFLEAHNIVVHYLPYGKMSPAHIRAIAHLAREGRFDVLHLHGYSSANFGRIVGWRLHIPTIMHEHAVLRVLPHQFIIDWLLRYKVRVAVAVSQAVKRFLQTGRSVPEHKIRIIHNGINVKAFAEVSREQANAFRERLGLRVRDVVVGTVTRFREEKGNRYLIEAAAKLANEFPEVYFVLVGDGPLRDDLQQRARAWNIESRVLFAGFVDDVRPALAAMDIVAIPSLQEGFGLAMVEAMAAGKSIVASDVGGLAEIAESEKTALLVPPGNSEALAEAIARLLRDASLRKKLGDAARNASERFSIESNVRELEMLYGELVPGLEPERAVNELFSEHG